MKLGYSVWYVFGGIMILISLLAVIWSLIIEREMVTFVSKNYMKELVQKEGYFNEMNVYDLRVRSAESVEEYRKIYIDSLMEFSEDEENMVRNMCTRANELLTGWSDALRSIPWKFIKIRKNIENGYPHTLGDVIILSDKFLEKAKKMYDEGVDTLIHEKVHVLQRLYPKWTEDVIKQWGFVKYEKNKDIYTRNNPDLPPRVWYGTSDGPIVQLYDPNPLLLSNSFAAIISNHSGKVKKISAADIGMPEYITQLEHPYEIMACMVPEIVKKRKDMMTDKELILYEALSTAPKPT